MRVVYTPRAAAQLARHLAYGIDHFGTAVATRTVKRLRSFVRLTITRFPRASRYHASIDAFESWVPGTPFVVYYRYSANDEIVTVIAIFHHAQDRRDFTP